MIDGHVDVPSNNEEALMKAVANQPVSVAIEAGGGKDLQFYSQVICRRVIFHLTLFGSNML